jgi:predicted Zn finger-like uncharacterized protein
MFSDNDEAITSEPDNNEGLLNGHDCPHCGMWFRLDDAKPVGKNKVRCPNCDWVIEHGS